MAKSIIIFTASFALSIGILLFHSLSKPSLSSNDKTNQKSKAFLFDIDAGRSPRIFCNFLSECYPHHVGKKDGKASYCELWCEITTKKNLYHDEEIHRAKLNKEVKFKGYSRLKVLYEPNRYAKEGNSVLLKSDGPKFIGNGNAIGTDIRDAKGQKIKISFPTNDSMKFSSNASAEFKELAFSMAKTTIGLKILKLMYSSPTKIEIEINKVDTPVTGDGHYIGAQTIPVISAKVDKYGRRKGPWYISSAKIVIFEAGIKDMAANNKGKVLIYGETINLRLFSVSDIVASFAVHEGTHVVYREFSGALNPNATKDELEKKPYENQLQHFKELQKRKNEKEPNGHRVFDHAFQGRLCTKPLR